MVWWSEWYAKCFPLLLSPSVLVCRHAVHNFFFFFFLVISDIFFKFYFIFLMEVIFLVFVFTCNPLPPIFLS